MVVDANAVKESARALLDSPVFHDVQKALPEDRMDRIWRGRSGRTAARHSLSYSALPELIAAGEANDVTLAYSHGGD